MGFSYSDEQEMIRHGARRFLAEFCSAHVVRSAMADPSGYSPELWRKMSSLGWMGINLPEQYGGAQGSFLETVALLEEMGRACVPGPYLSSTVVAGGCIAEAASGELQQAILPGLAAGEIILCLGLEEGSPVSAPTFVHTTATPRGDGFSLSGGKMFVPFAHLADHLLIACRTARAGSGPAEAPDGLTLFLLEAGSPGLQVRTLSTGCTDTLCEVVLDGVPARPVDVVGFPGRAWPVLQNVLARGAIAKCAEMTGGAQRILDMITAYAHEREQFGRPIGSFQAIQHHCANMLVDLEGCRRITLDAAARVSEGGPYQAAASHAKAWCNEAYRRIVALGHQILGGIGYCTEHDMPLYFRHARGAEVMFGDTEHHLEVVADRLFTAEPGRESRS